MSATEKYIENNKRFTESFRSVPASSPTQGVAVVTCMDARLDIFGALGMQLGEAHVIRNAGGIIDEGALRSLVISQRLLGTREIILIHHTGCGMLTFTDDDLRQQIANEVGYPPFFAPGAFRDLDEDVRAQIRHLQAEPLLPYRDSVRGFVFDVETGRLREVRLKEASPR